jgi:hypothetical protein
MPSGRVSGRTSLGCDVQFRGCLWRLGLLTFLYLIVAVVPVAGNMAEFEAFIEKYHKKYKDEKETEHR